MLLSKEVYGIHDELQHHGVKGQRWGVRRYQAKDGSLTPLGKKRYDNVESTKDSMKEAKERFKSSKSTFNKSYRKYNVVPTPQNRKVAEKNLKDMNVAKSVYKKSKLDHKVAKAELKGKFDSEEKKSKHRAMLEEKYREQGYSKKQAAVMASDRIKTEKILVATAALTLTACAVYATNKHIRDKTDRLIKSGDVLQRIEMQDTKGKLNDVFYTSKGKHDNKRYADVLGYTRRKQTGQAYLMQLQATGDVKVASKDKAVKTFSDLYKNDADFRNSVKDSVSSHYSGKNKVNIDKLSDRNVRKMYENFNSNLVNLHDSSSSKKFYGKLKEAGYGAVQDINDMKFSGYHAKNPLIVFDNSKKNIMVKSVTELTDESKMLKGALVEIGKGKVEGMAETLASPYTTAAIAGTAGAMYVSDRTSSSKSRTRR